MDNSPHTKTVRKNWLQKMGVGAIVFFSIKGIIWLGVFFGLFKFVGC